MLDYELIIVKQILYPSKHIARDIWRYLSNFYEEHILLTGIS